MTTPQMSISTLPDTAFRRVTLDMSSDEALERITAHLTGLSATETGTGYKIRDISGLVVAVLSEYERHPGEVGVHLAYRVGPSPSMRSVHRGRRIYEILEPHIW